MNTPEQLPAVTGSVLTTVPPPLDDAPLALIATDAEGMQESQRQLVQFFALRKATMGAEATELQLELNIAEQNGWRTIGLKRAHTLALKREEFYEKCRQAAEAGYVLIPSLPHDLFAIRTKRRRPKPEEWRSEHSQRSEAPAAGEGRYVDEHAAEHPIRREWTGADGKQRSDWYAVATAYQEVDFPVEVARAQLMGATAQALALKVFDEVGIVRDDSAGVGTVERRNSAGMRRGDPLIIGTIRDPRRSSGKPNRALTFLIAWYVDTRDL